MFSKGFPILSFVDLLACALGAATLLMFLFAVSGEQSASYAGAPRDFIMYKITVDDPNVKLRLMIRSPKTKKFIVADVEEHRSGLFQKKQLDGANIFFWGPARVFVHEKGVDRSKLVYTVYATFQDLGAWEIGVLYYDNSRLANGHALKASEMQSVVSDEITVTEQFLSRATIRTGNIPTPRTVKLGDYLTYSFNVE